VTFIPGWIPRGQAMASASLGPRPDLSMLCGDCFPCCPTFGRHLPGGVVVIITVHRGIVLVIKYSFVLSGAKHQTLIHE
jgi:hypothetical protein